MSKWDSVSEITEISISVAQWHTLLHVPKSKISQFCVKWKLMEEPLPSMWDFEYDSPNTQPAKIFRNVHLKDLIILSF